MAPSKKKKTVVAAASDHQWKVGDLVLAKVKGFPPWPARVCKPEEHGYKPDLKKVVVKFFFTKDIGYCSPADVEAFTEEKIQTLLKRHGRNARYVSAGKEIIDTYVKSKNGVKNVQVSTVTEFGNNEAASNSMEFVESSELIVAAGKVSQTSHTAKRGLLRSRRRRSANDNQTVENELVTICLESVQQLDERLNHNSKCNLDESSGDVKDNSTMNIKDTKSPDDSLLNDPEPWGSTEDCDSQNVNGDTDAYYCIENDNRMDRSDICVDSLDGDVEMSKGLGFGIKTCMKKRRNTTRKRQYNEFYELQLNLGNKSESEIATNNDVKDSMVSVHDFRERFNENNGDEHLPLVKRARVRMSESSLFAGCTSSPPGDISSKGFVENINILCEVAERKVDDKLVSAAGHTDPCTICADASAMSVHREPHELCLPPKNIDMHSLSSSEEEYSLPPSKRLQRALKAMSANSNLEVMPTNSDLEAIPEEDCTRHNMPHDEIHRVSSPRSPQDFNNSVRREESTDKTADSIGFFSCETSDVALDQSEKSQWELVMCNEVITEFSSQHGQAPIQSVHPNDILENDSAELTVNCDNSEEKITENNCDIDAVENANMSSSSLAECWQHSKDTSTMISSMDPESELSSRKNDCCSCYSQFGTVLCRSCVDGASASRSPTDGSNEFNKCERPQDNFDDQGVKSYMSNTCNLADKDGKLSHSSPFLADATESPTRTSLINTSLCHTSTSESVNDVRINSCPDSIINTQCKVSVSSTGVDEDKTDYVESQSTKGAAKCDSLAEGHSVLITFEAVLSSLTRTKESIGRATRIAIDCAKQGVSCKAMDVLIRTLESESNLTRRVDLFFLVDSITQCSRNLKGDVGGKYPAAVQLTLGRLLAAAAPPGLSNQENRRQCLKVLRLWLERNVLPESIIRQHMQELESFGASSSAGPYARRSARTERSLDDPVRDMEGMLVDEYGSNASLQLAGICIPQMLKEEVEEEGSDSDEGFEAVTPEHDSPALVEQENFPTKNHESVSEAVDMELEMEDVAPCEGEINSNIASIAPESQTALSFPPLPPSSPPFLPPPPPPPPLPPGHKPDTRTKNSDTKVASYPQNGSEDSRPSTAQSDSQRINHSSSHCSSYNQNGSRDHMQLPYQEQDASSSGSYNTHQDYNHGSVDNHRFHHKSYHPGHSYGPPSGHWSYMHGKSRRGNTGPPFSRRSWHDNGHGYNHHGRMSSTSYEFNHGWRNRLTRFNDSHHHHHHHPDNYVDKDLSYNPPGSYNYREPARYNEDWAYPPHGMNQRNYMPYRPSPEASSHWRPE